MLELIRDVKKMVRNQRKNPKEDFLDELEKYLNKKRLQNYNKKWYNELKDFPEYKEAKLEGVRRFRERQRREKNENNNRVRRDI
jgi:hypothetical protein